MRATRGFPYLTTLLRSGLVLIAAVWMSSVASAADQPGAVLIENARIFDGMSPDLIDGMDVLIEGNMISRIAAGIDPPPDALVINADGRTLMPGLIDMHWHSLFAIISQAKLLVSDVAYINIYAAKANEDALMRGFTTVRDVGGNVFGLKAATDQGVVNGPRIYPSGAYISQTAGHGDFRGPLDVPEDPGTPLDYLQRTGQTLIADGVPEVIKRTREVLRMGASQIKVMAGGGVSSLYDPLDTTQYTLDEMKAIVEVTENWNTYVTVHAFTDKAVRQAIEAGVKCIEHGFLLSEDTLRLMADKGIWLSIQPLLNDEDAIAFADPISEAKFVEVTNGTERVYTLAKQHGVKLVFGTDTLFDPALAEKQGKLLAKLGRWFEPWEALAQATGNAGELLALSGPRNPYPNGPLGVVAEGAYADLILVDGNPLENLDLVADAQSNFVLIMKNGVIYKNTL